MNSTTIKKALLLLVIQLAGSSIARAQTDTLTRDSVKILLSDSIRKVEHNVIHMTRDTVDITPESNLRTASRRPAFRAAARGGGAASNIERIAGSAGVSPTGAATYTVPIEVPPGINGVVPQLAFTYNSQSGSGMAGYGWNLSGISVITRIPATRFHDDRVGGVNLDLDDRYALDGQRLLLKSGTYGTNGAVYQTENYSNIKIISIGGTASGPGYFEVYYPDGSFAVYGNGSNSKSATDYAITYQENPQGIRINYSYTIDNNCVYISQISYGSKGTATAINEVNFGYENAGRNEQAYTGGTGVFRSKVLSQVITVGNGTNYRIYALLHDQVSALYYDRLTTIDEYSGDGVKNYEPITFQYSDTNSIISVAAIDNLSVSGIASNNSQVVTSDFTGDGTMDFIVYPNTNNKFWVFLDPVGSYSYSGFGSEIPTTEFVNLFPVSWLTAGSKLGLGQGIALVKEPVGAPVKFEVWSAGSVSPVSLQYTREWTPPADADYYSACSESYQPNVKVPINYLSGDFNGDGLTDILAISKPYNMITEDHLGTPDEYGTYPCEREYSYQDYSAVYFVNLDRRITTGFDHYGGNLLNSLDGSEKLYTGDFNGDGKTDILHITSGTMYVYDLDAANNLQLLWQTSDSRITNNYAPLLGDYNGDGKMDVLFPTSYGPYPANLVYALFSSKGESFIKQEQSYPFPNIAFNYDGYTQIAVESTLVPNDINGDGKTDMIWYETHTQNGHTTGSLSMIIYHNIGPSSATDAPAFEAGGIYSSTSTHLIHHPTPVFLNSDKPNFNLEFGVVSDNSTTLFDYQKELQKDVQLDSVSQDGVTHSIDYKRLVPGYGTDIPLYADADNQVYPNVDIHLAPGLKVVDRLSRTFNGNAIQQVFGYKGAVANTEGLGFMGFGEMTSSNWHINAGDANRMFTISVNDPALRGAPLKVFTSKQFYINPTVKDVQAKLPDITRATPATAAETVEATQSVTFLPGFEANGANGVFIGKISDPAAGIADGGALTDYITRTDYTYNTELLTGNVFVNTPSSTSTKNLLNGTNTLQTFAYDSYYNVSKANSNLSGVGYTTTDITYDNSPGSAYYIGRPLTKKTTSNNGSDTFSTEEQYTYTGYLPTQVKRKGNNTAFMTENLTYDTYGNVTQKTTVAPNSDARTVSMQYDGTGRFLTQLTDVEGRHTNSTYDASTGDLLTVTNPDGLTTTNTYDQWGRLTQSTDYLGKSAYSTYTKSGADLVIDETDDEGAATSTTINALGQTTEVITKDVLGQLVGTAYQYDVYDRPVGVSEPSIGGSYTQWNQTEYDEYGRIKKTTAYTGKETNITYSGLASTVNDGTKSVTTTSNALGQTVSTTDPGGTINHTYFANGNLHSSDLGGSAQVIEQDGWGRKTKLTDPSAGVYTYTYNDFGETTQETTPKGTTNYTIDASTGKLTGKTVTGDATSLTYTYTYDGTTKLLTASGLTNGDGNDITYTYGYDSNKRLNSSIEDNTYDKFTKTLTYDAFGRVATENNEAKNKSNSITVSRDITNNYQYGQLKSITDNTSGTTLHNVTGLNARGQVTEAYMSGTNLKQTNAYDTYGLLTELKTNRLSGTPAELMKLNYSFDALRGNLDSRSNTAFGTTWSESFSYDDLDRLTDFNDNNGSRSQGYDGRGRITANSRLGTYNYSGNSYQQTGLASLTAYALYHYQNDYEQLITYNAFKSPVKITETGKEIIDFQYNGDEGRSHMYYGSTDADKFDRPFRRHYSEDGSVEITEDIPNGKTSFVFYLGGDAYDAPAIWKYETSGAGTTDAIYYLHRDHLGSINLITDASANIVEKRQFDAWGNVVKLEDGAGNPLTNFVILDRGYTGHEDLLGVGLINMNARLYDPLLHRFLSPDNYVQDPSNSQNFNRYGYGLNNPLAHVDPSGEFIPLLVFAGAALIGGGGNVWSNWDKIVKHPWSAVGYFASGAAGGATAVVNPALGGAIAIAGNVATDIAYGNLPKFNGIGSVAKYVGGTLLDGIGAAGAGGLAKSAYSIAINAGWVQTVTTGAGQIFHEGLTNIGFSVVQEVSISSAKVAAGVPLAETAARVAGKAAAKGGTNVVYEGLDKVTGAIKYAGITERAPAVRFGEHLNSIGTGKELLRYRVVPGATNLSRIDARILEQTLINQHGLGNLLNLRNSIAPKYWLQYGIKP